MSKQKKAKAPKETYVKALKGRAAANVGSVFVDIFFLCILVLLIIGIVFSINFKIDGKEGTDMFGTHMTIVADSSMRSTSETDVSDFDVKSIEQYTMVFMDKLPEQEDKVDAFYKGIKVGDVLTYTYSSRVYTHRVIKVEGSKITLKGDTLSDATAKTIDYANESNNNIIGKVTGKSYFLGLLVSSVTKPLGFTCIFIVPCIGIVIIELFKFFRIGIEEEEDLLLANQNKDLELLKEQLALKNKQANKDEEL